MSGEVFIVRMSADMARWLGARTAQFDSSGLTLLNTSREITVWSGGNQWFAWPKVPGFMPTQEPLRR